MRIDDIRAKMIRTGKTRRPINPDAVKKLAESIKLISLQNPITLRHGASGHSYLVSGAYRLDAFKLLTREVNRRGLPRQNWDAWGNETT